MDWFKNAPVVDDLFSRSSDAEFIFDDDVECAWTALEWRECDVPVSAFALASTLDEHLAALLPAESMKHERQRVCDIEMWIQEMGGVSNALHKSPLLITLRNGMVNIEDGYHRLGVAIFCHGVESVKALCASYPAVTMDKRPAKSPSMGM